MSSIEQESQLIRDAVAGDRTSLAQLLLLHYDAVHRHIEQRMTQQLQGLVRPEDVLQQTFVRAASGITTFEVRHVNAFRGWLRTIADNLLRDAEKRRRRERREELYSDHSLAAPINRLAGTQTSPSRRVARSESIHNMKIAMARLPAEQRDVLQRRYFQGESLDEIAAAIGRTKDAARSLCFRARRNLRAVMGQTSLYFSD